MLGLSPAHLLVIVLVVVLIFGTAKLKNIGRDIGGAIRDFKDSVKASDVEVSGEPQQHILLKETKE